MNTSCTFVEWPRRALFFTSQRNTGFVLNKVVFTGGVHQAGILPTGRQFPALSRLCYCLRASSHKHLFNNGTWLFNILFGFCFIIFLIEFSFNCLFCTPRAWVRKEGFMNEMMLVITSFLSVFS